MSGGAKMEFENSTVTTGDIDDMIFSDEQWHISER